MVPERVRRALLNEHPACEACGSTESLQIDHVVPIAAGGSDDKHNLRVLCRRCNLIAWHAWLTREMAEVQQEFGATRLKLNIEWLAFVPRYTPEEMELVVNLWPEWLKDRWANANHDPKPRIVHSPQALPVTDEFGDKNLREMVLVVANELDGRFRVSDVRDQIRARSSWARHCEQTMHRGWTLYNEIVGELNRMKKEFRHVNPGEWERIYQ